jgi:hypothetical protein
LIDHIQGNIMAELTIDRVQLEELFDEVSQRPESSRGYDVETTCRLLAEAARERFPSSQYENVMRKLEDIYIGRFIHTISIDSTFAPRIRAGIVHFL